MTQEESPLDDNMMISIRDSNLEENTQSMAADGGADYEESKSQNDNMLIAESN